MSKPEGLYPSVPHPAGYPQAPVMPVSFGPNPQNLVCPHCHQQTTTNMLAETSNKTHLIALILCLFGCIPCCLIPYCVDTCKNKNHYCSSCNAYLGEYRE